MPVDEISIPGSSGIAADLRVIYRDAAGKVGNNATGLYETWADGSYANYQVSGITEEGTSAHYLVTRPAWVTSPGSAEWIEVVGGTPTTDLQQGIGALDDAADGITTETGSQLPATRRLPFKLKVAGVFTDPTGSTVTLRDPTQTFGVRRQSTGATVVGISPLQTYTRTSAGVYYYEVPETGLVLEYGAEFVHPVTGDTERVLLTSLPPSIDYSTDSDVDEVFAGSTNANLWHDGENEGDANHIAAMRSGKKKRARVRLHNRVKAALKDVGKTVTTPIYSTDDDTTDTLRQVHALYTAGYAIWSKKGQGSKDRPNEGDNFIALGDELLDQLIVADLPGVDLTDVEDETGGAGEPQFVTIDRGYCLQDENASSVL